MLTTKHKNHQGQNQLEVHFQLKTRNFLGIFNMQIQQENNWQVIQEKWVTLSKNNSKTENCLNPERAMVANRQTSN